MNFCQKCHFMLYTRYKKRWKYSGKLLQKLRVGQHEKSTQTKISLQQKHLRVWKSYSDDYAAMKAVKNQYTVFDPTLPRLSNIECINRRCATNIPLDKRGTAVIVHNVQFLQGDLQPLQEYFEKLDPDSTVDHKRKTVSWFKMSTPEYVQKLWSSTIVLHGCTALQPVTEVEREIIFIKYDRVNLKYLYMCSTCSTSWKSQ